MRVRSATAGTDELLTTVLATPDPAVDGVALLDDQIAVLRERVRSIHPRFARLADGYREDIDLLLELRYWLTGPSAAA